MDKEVAEAAMAEAISEEELRRLCESYPQQRVATGTTVQMDFLFLSGLGGKDDDDVDAISEFFHFGPFWNKALRVYTYSF